jgi:hypothetical protein
MTPKTETMWMAWHPSVGFIAQTGDKIKSACDYRLKSSGVFSHKIPEFKIIEVTIQPKKRGKG